MRNAMPMFAGGFAAQLRVALRAFAAFSGVRCDSLLA
jgi:hypothetical protein